MTKTERRVKPLSRLQRDVRAADRLHAGTLEQLEKVSDENKMLRAQLLATSIELLRARHVIAATQRRVAKR